MSQQGPLPYLKYCGTEVANAARVLSYLRRGLGDTTRGVWEIGVGDVCGVLYHPDGEAAFVVNGGEITDTRRAEGALGPLVVGHSYDGFVSDSSYGLWDADTNLCQNGNAATNLTGWNTDLGSVAQTFTRDTTDGKFASTSFKMVATAAGGFLYRIYSLPISVAAGSPYTVVAWMKGTPGKTVHLQVNANGGAHGTGAVGDAPLVLDGTWQKFVATGVTDFADRTTLDVYMMMVSPGIGSTLSFGGVNLTATAYQNPYIHTDGGTAFRQLSKVRPSPAQLPLFATDVGYAVVRERIEAVDASQHSILYIPGASGYIQALFSANVIKLISDDGVGQNVATASVSPATAGTLHTFVFEWNATQIKATSDNGTVTTVSRTRFPVGSIPFVDIGSVGGGSQFLAGEVKWLAVGRGTLSAADKAAIWAQGDTDPTEALFSNAANVTVVWPAVSPTYAPMTDFVSPATDPAPWFDSSEVGSQSFLGVVLLDMQGYDSTLSRNVTQRLGSLGGGIFGSIVRKPRPWKFRAALVSADDAGAEFGLRWLTNVLQGTCDNCSGCDMQVRLVCPPASGLNDNIGKWSSYSVALTDGPHEVEKWSPKASGEETDILAGCRDVVIVEWEMVSANPFLYQDATLHASYVTSDFGTTATKQTAWTPPLRGSLGSIFEITSAAGFGPMLLEAYNVCGGGATPILQIELSNIPANSTVTVDSAKHQITVAVTDPITGDVTIGDGTYLVTLAPNTGIQWIENRDCDSYQCYGIRAKNNGETTDVSVAVKTQVREG